MLAANSDSKPVVLLFSTYFVSFLPKLTKAGEVVPYSEKMQKRVASTSAPLRDAGSIAKLPPNQLSLATTINLPDWYGALQPGVYELQLKYRELGGAEIQSNTVMFEVLH